ncbi:MAG: hypothetical protein JWM93_2457 [Frankiales bacterium]|nr:hypothetical protein [Frankiales bacterium]
MDWLRSHWERLAVAAVRVVVVYALGALLLPRWVWRPPFAADQWEAIGTWLGAGGTAAAVWFAVITQRRQLEAERTAVVRKVSAEIGEEVDRWNTHGGMGRRIYVINASDEAVYDVRVTVWSSSGGVSEDLTAGVVSSRGCHWVIDDDDWTGVELHFRDSARRMWARTRHGALVRLELSAQVGA